MAIGFLVNLPIAAPKPEEIKYVRLGGQTVRVELAISAEAQALGLSGRAGLAEGEGLLFVFNQPGKHMFWMKDMNFPIDILWISESQAVMHIEKNVSPATYPQRFGPDAYSKYVLEVPAGFADKYGINTGNRVLFAE